MGWEPPSPFGQWRTDLSSATGGKLADFVGKEACHAFSAGYLARASAVTGFAERKDRIFADKNLHSSLWSGIQLSEHLRTLRPQ